MIYKNTKLIRNIIKRICKNKALAFTWNVKADTKVYSCCKIFQLVIIIKNYTTSIIFNISFYSLQITDFHSFEEVRYESSCICWILKYVVPNYKPVLCSDLDVVSGLELTVEH